jgi:hypothetical protein
MERRVLPYLTKKIVQPNLKGKFLGQRKENKTTLSSEQPRVSPSSQITKRVRLSAPHTLNHPVRDLADRILLQRLHVSAPVPTAVRYI